MAHSQSILKSETGWQWPTVTAGPWWLEQVVSALDQTRVFISKITHGVTDDDLWWRPESSMNAMGNLLLHLAGTEHQWIENKVGKAQLDRNRDHEFSARGGYTTLDLMEKLANQQKKTARILMALVNSPEDKATQYCFHYTENHFAYHCGELAILRRLRNPAFRLYG